MSPYARLAAIDDVHIEGPAHLQDTLRWFYGELVGLALCDHGAGNALVFKSDRLRLSIRLNTAPTIEGVAHRVHCVVGDLDDVAAQLEANHHEFQWIHGLQFTDRAISVLDPAGNRILLRHRYSAVIF